MGLKLSNDQAKALGIEGYIPPRVARSSVKNELGQNKTEARFDRRLADIKARGVIHAYWFESVKFRLANRCWYTPDFLVQYPSGSCILYEVKGTFVREDSWVKLKVAAETMPFPFFLAQWKGKEWEITRIEGRGSSPNKDCAFAR